MRPLPSPTPYVRWHEDIGVGTNTPCALSDDRAIAPSQTAERVQRQRQDLSVARSSSGRAVGWPCPGRLFIPPKAVRADVMEGNAPKGIGSIRKQGGPKGKL